MKFKYLLLLLVYLSVFSIGIIYANARSNHSENQNKNSEAGTPISCLNLEGLPPVGNQVVAGSCYAWAAAYYYLTYLQWQEFGWDVTDPNHQFSPAFVYNLTNGGVDNGAYEGTNARRDAFKVFETMGCATMADMPYDYRTYRTYPGEDAFRNGMKFRTLSTHYIYTRSDSGIQALKNHLLEGNIAVLGIYGYSNLNNIYLYNDTYCVSQTSGGRLYWHEVTVVGFDDSLVTADGVGAFRLVNEWGIGWGDRGFFWMSYQAVKHIKTSYGCAMYATDRIGYEPELIARLQVQHTDRYNLIYNAGFGSVELPDTLLTFFDFHPMSLATGIAYPQTAILLDLTDMVKLISQHNPNTVFLSIHDKRINNNHSGTIASFMLEDLSNELAAICFDTPVIIPDSGFDAIANITLDYSLSPPQNLTAELDSIKGQVNLAWDAAIDMTNFLDYHIYQDGTFIDSTRLTEYAASLPPPGNHRYTVSAQFEMGESLQPIATVYRPLPLGIPFSDDFETSLYGWIQAGISGIDAKIMEHPVYDGSYAVGIQTNETDYTAIVRLFQPIEGAVFETWFNMESYPIPGQGFGAGAWLTNQQGELLGVFINNNGNPGCIYPVLPDFDVAILDSTLIVNLNQWYKHKIWYCDGKLHAMLLDENWNVLVNKIINFRDVQISQAALLAWGLAGDWNYFDNFSIQEWNGANYEYFTPVESTDQPYALIITDATIENETLHPGDEIAVFDGDFCVGAIAVDDNFPVEFNAWQSSGDNPGFSPENTMTFRIWNCQNDSEHYADATYEIGDGMFSHGIFSRLSLIGGQIVNVKQDEIVLPKNFSITPAYPNPFNSTTAFILELPEASAVIVNVYNIVGQKVTEIANSHFDAGKHKIEFEAKSFSSGIYFIHTTVKEKMNEVSKVLLMK